jgi:hypothetical protein
MIKFYGRGSSRGHFGQEYNAQNMTSSFGDVHSFEPRTTTPAPAYSNSNFNVNSRTPYSRQSNEDELQPEKHGVVVRDTVFPASNKYQAQPVNYHNEKGGFI